MARMDSMIRKLQKAIVSKNIYIKIHQRQFFASKDGKMLTCYCVTKPVWSEKKQKMIDQEVLRTCSAAEVVKFLAKMWEELGNGPNS